MKTLFQKGKRFLPLFVLLFGILVLVILVATKPRAKRAQDSNDGIVVAVKSFSPSSQQVRIEAQGEVIAAREVRLSAEVTGRVVWQAEQLVPGGRFEAGQVILRVDPRDYELALEQQKAAVDKAQLNLDLERGRKKIAEREWRVLTKKEPTEKSRALALRVPQLKTANMNLEAAQSGLRRAEINLERTVVRAPFNAFVKQESVDVGQWISPQSGLATLVGTDEAWVQIAIPVEYLGQVHLPGHSEQTSMVTARHELPTQITERSGRVTRLLGDLDPVGRMARLLVTIEDPLALTEATGSLPLLFGAFVRVTIEGKTLENVVEIPRAALREEDHVFVMNAQDILEVRKVEVAWRQRDSVLIASGIAATDRLIVSRMVNPIAGTKLRLSKVEDKASKVSELSHE
jgi:RND family efflux transporter MFP subunit